MPSFECSDQPGTIPIRDAACLILVDHSQSEPRLLMGRRLASQVFLPNKWVFPGGRVDEGDHALAAVMAETGSARNLHASQAPFALAAIRELFEEAGVVLGCRARDAQAVAMEGAWQPFAMSGLTPACNVLMPLARAITPPGFERRFDTWFFIADRRHADAQIYAPDGELLDLGWFTMAQVRGLDLPYITRLIVDDVASWLQNEPPDLQPYIPFYFQAVEGYRRTLFDASGPVLAP